VSRSADELAAFIQSRTAVAPVPLVPELRLHQATEVTPLWHASAAEPRCGPPPYWAFPWAGGQAIARHLLDAPEAVRGRRVFDFASGSGLCAIAAARAGAASVVACDLDPFCAAAVRLNAAQNGVAVEFRPGDPIGDPLDGFDVVLAGDVFYEEPLASRALAWLRRLATAGKLVLAGDPGRTYSPAAGFAVRARHDVPSAGDVEARPVLATRVLQLDP
jgi:predicted nicotinamide N-methyase